MNPYELMFILDTTQYGEEIVDEYIERFGRLIVDNGGEVTGVEKWGKRRFAYAINNLTEGYYVLMNFKAAGSVVGELSRVLRITDGVVRHLVVRLDEDQALPAESQESTDEAAEAADEAPAADEGDEAAVASAEPAASQETQDEPSA